MCKYVCMFSVHIKISQFVSSITKCDLGNFLLISKFCGTQDLVFPLFFLFCFVLSIRNRKSAKLHGTRAGFVSILFLFVQIEKKKTKKNFIKSQNQNCIYRLWFHFKILSRFVWHIKQIYRYLLIKAEKMHCTNVIF